VKADHRRHGNVFADMVFTEQDGIDTM